MKQLSTKTPKKAAFSDMKKYHVNLFFLYNEKKIREITKIDEFPLSLNDYEQTASL